MENLLSVAIEAATNAGEILLKGFHTSFSIRAKDGKNNLVTEYDLLSEKYIIDFLCKRFPDFGFLAEESGQSKKGEIDWVIDPLDGTSNYAHGIPHFAITIAAQQKDITLVGLIYDPITKELFTAENEKGAYLNGKKLTTSSCSDITSSFLSTAYPSTPSNERSYCIDKVQEIGKAGISIQKTGSSALNLAYVAAGRYDGFFGVGLCPWDCLAGNLLVKEANGKISDWTGNPFILQMRNTMVASNSFIHKTLVESL